MPLSKRQFNCPDCGISIDRDLNASINICRLGQSVLINTQLPEVIRYTKLLKRLAVALMTIGNN